LNGNKKEEEEEGEKIEGKGNRGRWIG